MDTTEGQESDELWGNQIQVAEVGPAGYPGAIGDLGPASAFASEHYSAQIGCQQVPHSIRAVFREVPPQGTPREPQRRPPGSGSKAAGGANRKAYEAGKGTSSVLMEQWCICRCREQPFRARASHWSILRDTRKRRLSFGPIFRLMPALKVRKGPLKQQKSGPNRSCESNSSTSRTSG